MLYGYLGRIRFRISQIMVPLGCLDVIRATLDEKRDAEAVRALFWR